MSLKKAGSRKKSVTWQDIGGDAKLPFKSTTGSLMKNSTYNTPIIPFKVYNFPFHYLGLIYYLLYIEYDQLIRYETINRVLFRALPLTYFGQIVWLFFLQTTPVSHNEKKKITSVVKPKKLDLNLSLLIVASTLSIISSFFIYIVAVLLGSPILVFQTQTYFLSLHLSFLITFPLVVVYKFNSAHWKAFIVLVSDYKFLFSNPVFLIALTAALGSWAGVLTIPLDWDRDWQLYPISLVIGAYLGGSVGGLLALIAQYLK